VGGVRSRINGVGRLFAVRHPVRASIKYLVNLLLAAVGVKASGCAGVSTVLMATIHYCLYSTHLSAHLCVSEDTLTSFMCVVLACAA